MLTKFVNARIENTKKLPQVSAILQTFKCSITLRNGCENRNWIQWGLKWQKSTGKFQVLFEGSVIGIKCKFGKVVPMKNYLKTPKSFRRSALEMCRIRRKSHFQRPPKYTYLGAFGVKLKIKFSKKKKTISLLYRKKQTILGTLKTNLCSQKRIPLHSTP